MAPDLGAGAGVGGATRDSDVGVPGAESVSQQAPGSGPRRNPREHAGRGGRGWIPAVRWSGRGRSGDRSP